MTIRHFVSNAAIATSIIAMTAMPAFANEQGTTQKQQDLEKIRTFLYTPEIRAAMEGRHGRDVENIYTKVQKLSDAQINAIAENTPDTLQFGAAQYESKTAETISDKWINFADKWLMIGLLFSGFLLLIAL